MGGWFIRFIKIIKTKWRIQWILHIIDVYSRYIWFYTLKNKTAEVSLHVIDVIEIVKKKYLNNIIYFTTDTGGPLTKYLNDNQIKHYIANSQDNTKNRTRNVERYNRTFLKLYKKNICF